MINLKTAVIIIAASSLSVSLAADSTQSGTLLEFKVDPPKLQGAPAPSYDLSVYLSPKLISTEASGIRVDRDFSSLRSVKTDVASKVSVDDSIFAPLAFRLAELQNREMIASVLRAAGGQSEGIQSPSILAHIFSIKTESSDEITRRDISGRVEFSHEGKCLAEYSTSGPPTPREIVTQFAMFLRYEYGLHPRILEDLQSLDYIPSEIVVCLQDPSESRHTLTLSKKTSPSPAFPVLSSSPIADPLYTLSRKIGEMSPEEKKSISESMLERAQGHAVAGRNLESILLMLAYGVSTGKLPQGFPASQKKFADDEQILLLFKSISPPDEASAREALVNLESIQNSVSDGAPLVMVFRANITAALGAPAESTSLFLEALSREPGLTGAWFDLGAAFDTAFDTPSAWRCYDAGRTLSSDHPGSEEIRAREREMIEDHPEFFL